jgi:hypothetical protein
MMLAGVISPNLPLAGKKKKTNKQTNKRTNNKSGVGGHHGATMSSMIF